MARLQHRYTSANGQVAEYQMSIHELEAIEGNHADYDIIRAGSDGTDAGNLALSEATQRSRALFEEAWKAHLEKNGLSEDQVQEMIDQIRISLRNPEWTRGRHLAHMGGTLARTGAHMGGSPYVKRHVSTTVSLAQGVR